MQHIDLAEKRQRYQNALNTFIERIAEDSWILGAVLVGSIAEETILQKESLYLWIIESDGVTLRKKSDGEEVRIWRCMVEHDVNIWAELIPRSRFKRMVEGSSRTAFSYNFFAKRELVYSRDDSIVKWFNEANSLAQRDQQNDLLVATLWAVHALRGARKLLDVEKDMDRAWQASLDAAHAIAGAHVVESGEICEYKVIYKAMTLNPDLFEVVYSTLLSGGASESIIRAALDAGDAWLNDRGPAIMEPLVQYLKKQARVVGLSELSDHFAYTQLYPWHLESACEWLVRRGLIEKLAAEITLTKRSRMHMEEPAYLYHGA